MPTRKALRLPHFDYARAGAYFVTVCLQERRPLLGRIHEDTVDLGPAGRIVAEELTAIALRHPGVTIDTAVVMPDHVHAVILLLGGGATLGAVVGGFKSQSARRLNTLLGRQGEPLWQRGFFEHVVRDDEDLLRVRTYIVQNPWRWSAARNRHRRRRPPP